jgi:eukaryotic-like serine/threonine-protein kinase
MEGDETSGWKPGKPFAFMPTSFEERDPSFSPDGRWLAYASNESGMNSEIYVRPFPGPGPRSTISTAGGIQPMWSSVRNELFYWSPTDQKFMVSSYTGKGSSFQAGKPVAWSDGAFIDHAPPTGMITRPFDLHPDGKQFAVLTLPPAKIQEKLDTVVFITNFFEELRRLAPVDR